LFELNLGHLCQALVNFLFARNRTKDVSVFAHELLADERCFAVAAPEAVWRRVPRESVIVEAL